MLANAHLAGSAVDLPVTALLAYGGSIKPLFEQVLTAMNQADKR